jgi:predicted DNA-binding transcriptional regulator YafY
VLPGPSAPPGEGLDSTRLLRILGAAYGQGSPTARQRAVQRDLEELLKEGRIELVNPGGKPLRFRRIGLPADEDPLILQYALQQVGDLIAAVLPLRRLDRLWQRLLSEVDGPLLDEQRLRVVPDTLRLQPAELYPDVLEEVIRALAQRSALRVLYANAAGVRGEAVIHPQALVQRGPIPYLFALKNDEDTPVRMYALHRMIRAEAMATTPARAAVGFDLDRAIAEGQVDFSRGEPIDLDLRVRGYLVQLLSVCPLSKEQHIEDEPEGSAFRLRVRARVPASGQLLRWLLGGGDNLEVIAPPDLRECVAAQGAKIAALYGDDPEPLDDPC